MPDAPLSPEVDFLRIQDELWSVQQELSQALYRRAEDPRADLAGARDTLAALRSRRDTLLDRWGRAGLAFLMHGGQIQLLAPRSRPPGPAPLVETPPAARPMLAPEPTDTARSTAASVAGLRSTWSQAGPPSVELRPSPADLDELTHTLLDQLGPVPEAPATAEAAHAELARLGAAIGDLRDWRGRAAEAQQAMVGLVVSRARQLQDDAADGILDDQARLELDRLFSILSAFSKREQPGFVFGLMRTHAPTRGSWHADALWWADRLEAATRTTGSSSPDRPLTRLRAFLDRPGSDDPKAFLEAVGAALDAGVRQEDPELVRLTRDRLDALKTRARFKRLRRAIRDATASSQTPPASMSQDASWERAAG